MNHNNSLSLSILDAYRIVRRHNKNKQFKFGTYIYANGSYLWNEDYIIRVGDSPSNWNETFVKREYDQLLFDVIFLTLHIPYRIWEIRLYMEHLWAKPFVAIPRSSSAPILE